MIPDELRRASAHVLVDDLAAPALSESDEHHVFRVLRVRDGDLVTVTDGLGGWRICVADNRALVPRDDVRRAARRSPTLTVAFAIPKQDRPEWIVQKLTELGIDRIVPLHAERSVVRWNEERTARHVAKLRRVAAEALQQSRGVWLPEVTEPVEAATLLPVAAAAEPGARPLGADVTTVAIGPEGGWSSHELEIAAATVSIGSTVLRVETAAIVAAVHLVQHAE